MPDAAADAAISEIVETFAMERHRTAGWISQHYRDSEVWGRANLSSGYHLLIADEPLPRHKMDGIAIWHHYMGAPAELVVSSGNRQRDVTILGRDLAVGQRPQLAILAYHWQSCRTLGAWSLLGCTLSPGYSPRAAIVLNANA